jgi:hypothetical protein
LGILHLEFPSIGRTTRILILLDLVDIGAPKLFWKALDRKLGNRFLSFFLLLSKYAFKETKKGEMAAGLKQKSWRLI